MNIYLSKARTIVRCSTILLLGFLLTNIIQKLFSYQCLVTKDSQNSSYQDLLVHWSHKIKFKMGTKMLFRRS